MRRADKHGMDPIIASKSLDLRHKNNREEERESRYSNLNCLLPAPAPVSHNYNSLLNSTKKTKMKLIPILALAASMLCAVADAQAPTTAPTKAPKTCDVIGQVLLGTQADECYGAATAIVSAMAIGAGYGSAIAKE